MCNIIDMKKITLVCSLLLAASSVHILAQDAALLEAERSRGILTGGQGVKWNVSVSGSTSARFIATSQSGTIYAEVTSPEDALNRRYLAESSGEMWFWKPGLSRPISVSKRQRLNGDAAIGDIASTSFVDGYSVQGQEAGTVNGEAATVYSLKANSLSDTYALIKYWVTTNGNLGKKAEFYSASGTMIRSATMDYGNQAMGRPFLSRMVISESGSNINLSFSNVQVGSFPSSTFTQEYLTRKPEGGVSAGKPSEKPEAKPASKPTTGGNSGDPKKPLGGLFKKKEKE